MIEDTRTFRRLINRKSTPPPSEHRLEFLDQTALELMRVAGRSQLMQCIWVYEHALDRQGLKRFHQNLYRSLGGRLIERAPVPFGRPRWVRPKGDPPPIHVASRSRPRADLLDWADELADLPIDPEWGPGWHLAVQPFDDDSTGVCIVCSHVIFDGVGGIMAIVEAITGNIRDGGYDAPGARTRKQAVSADLRQAVRDLPLTLGTVIKAVKMAGRMRDEFTKMRGVKASPTEDGHVVVPSVAVYIDVGEWDATAISLGGNSYSLLAGFAAKLAEHLGRQRDSDQAVTLVMAINMRESLDDDRALAMAFATATVDASTATSDLSEIRTAVRVAREKAKTEKDPAMELMALIPWMPKLGAKIVAQLLFAYSEDLPVSCSNLGDLPPDLAQADGTPAEYVLIRALDTDVTLGEMQRSHGQLVVVSGRINGKVSISVEAYELGAENSKERLRAVVAQVLDEFGLTGLLN